MKYTTTINAASVFGITAARAAYNAALPATVEQGEGEARVTVPNPELLASDSAYLDFVLQSAIASWCKQFAPAVAPPPPPTVVVNGVPQSVTRRQARQALIMANKINLVQPAIDAIVDPTQRALMQSEWDDSQAFERQRPSLIQMAGAIGLTTPAQIDELFVAASRL